MIEYGSHIRRELAHERAERLAEDYRRARAPRQASGPSAVRRRIAALAAIAHRGEPAHDPAYRH